MNSRLTILARPLRILQLFNRYLQPGGEEKSVARIAEDLEWAGHQVTRFWTASEEWSQPGGPSRWRQPLLLWRNSEILARLRAAHESARPDCWLVHNVYPVMSASVYATARDLKVPVLHWLHNYRPISPSGTLMAGSRALDPSDRWLYLKETAAGSWNGPLMTAWFSGVLAWARWRGWFDSVAAWIAVSDEMRLLFERAHWQPGRLHTLRHSWHIQPPGVPLDNGGYFLFLGRMVESKGVRFLIDLFRDPALQKTALVMAGQGPLADELRGSSPSNVQWIGHVEGDEKRTWIGRCRAVLFPSIWPEPLSTIAYEAYQAHKPILSSELGGMKEIVRHEQTGLLLPPADPSTWRAAILRLSDDADLASAWGQAGRGWLEENASTEAWNRQFEQIADIALRV